MMALVRGETSKFPARACLCACRIETTIYVFVVFALHRTVHTCSVEQQTAHIYCLGIGHNLAVRLCAAALVNDSTLYASVSPPSRRARIWVGEQKANLINLASFGGLWSGPFVLVVVFVVVGDQCETSGKTSCSI